MIAMSTAALPSPAVTSCATVYPHRNSQIRGLRGVRPNSSHHAAASLMRSTALPLRRSSGDAVSRLRAGVAFSAVDQQQGVTTSAATLAPPEIDYDSPPDLLSALETPRFNADYGEGARAVLETPTVSSSTSDFRWDRHWYAAHALDHIDPAVPHAVTILGRPMVLWRDATETWRCFLDECPHRRVPLSEGRIDETGRLACSYHAWSFNGNGSCACIPQASEGPESRAVNNPRSCCVSFPLKVELGILFVWPDETSADIAASTPPIVPPGHNDPTVPLNYHVRDLPYSYELLVENGMDPAHVPVAHHGCSTLNRNQASPLKLQLTRFDQSGFEGFLPALESTMYKGTVRTSTVFPTPGLFYYASTREMDGKEIRGMTATFVTPTTPGNSRAILVSVLPAKLASSPVFKVARLLGLLHLPFMDLFDSDALFLHYQEVAMNAKEARDGSSWRDTYFLPTRSDLFVITYRKWLERFAHGGVKYGPGWELRRSPGGTREQLEDRANGHVANCQICKGVVTNYKKARIILATVTGACLLLVGGMLGSALTISPNTAAPSIAFPLATLLVLAAICGGAVVLCNNIIQKFVYRGWDHARMP